MVRWLSCVCERECAAGTTVGDVALVLAVSAAFGVLARRCGQPPVIGQILAGILFGPTLLGRLPGHLTDRLFPHAALSYASVLAQVAVVIFMLGVGYEIAWPSGGRRGSTPLLIAACALLVPNGPRCGGGAGLPVGLQLPLFFVVTGLSANISALNGSAFVVLAIVCVVAGAGKLGPGYAASRVGGLGRREAATVAVLVNTRGLTELIALNAGLQAGVIGARLFSILVLMALLMTVVTAPLLRLVHAPTARPSEVHMNADVDEISSP
jgi:Kef-type K+ transport system membrane component KefB